MGPPFAKASTAALRALVDKTAGKQEEPGPMEKPAAPVRDAGQARAVTLHNGAASLPGPPACFSFAKCQGAGAGASFTMAQYHI